MITGGVIRARAVVGRSAPRDEVKQVIQAAVGRVLDRAGDFTRQSLVIETRHYKDRTVINAVLGRIV